MEQPNTNTILLTDAEMQRAMKAKAEADLRLTEALLKPYIIDPMQDGDFVNKWEMENEEED